MSEDLYTLRDLALAAAQAGAAAALPYFRRPDLQIEWKQDDSPVTLADRGAEAAIRAYIQRLRPTDSWLGEESGEASGSSGLCWIVDPIDGTRNFVRGIPLWAVLVACARQQLGSEPEVLAAAVLFPGLNESYDALRGGGARCNGQPIGVSDCSSLDQALWCYETPEWFRQQGLWPLFEALSQRCALSRGLCDAYGHMLVASGRADCMVEPQLALWDVAATSLIVEEAGGCFSDLAGKRPGICSGNAVLSNGHLHPELMQLIHQTGPCSSS